MQIGRKCDERSLWGSDHTRHTSYYAVVIEIYQAFRSSLSSLAYNAVTDLAKTKAETRRRHRDIKRDRERASERESETNLAPSARAPQKRQRQRRRRRRRQRLLMKFYYAPKVIIYKFV